MKYNLHYQKKKKKNLHYQQEVLYRDGLVPQFCRCWSLPTHGILDTTYLPILVFANAWAFWITAQGQLLYTL